MVLTRRLVDATHRHGLAQRAATVGADHAHAGVERPIDDRGPLLGVEVGFSCHSSPLRSSLCSIEALSTSRLSAQAGPEFGADRTATRGGEIGATHPAPPQSEAA